MYFDARLTHNKYFEIGYQHHAESGGIDVRWQFRTRGDHAGLSFHVQLWRWFFELNIYDCRHWNYNTNTWEKRDAVHVQDP